MGSGTTIGEAAKLGARAIGRDINSVAHFLVRNALAFHDRDAVLRTFREIERDVADQIRTHYKTTLPDGTEGEVLYYFWVKQVIARSAQSRLISSHRGCSPSMHM